MNSKLARTRTLRGIGVSVALTLAAALSACAGGSTSGGSSGGSGSTTVLKAGIVLNNNDPQTKLVREVADNVAKRTDGRVKIEVFPSSQLGSETDVYQQAKLGNNVIAWGGTDDLSKYAAPQSAVLLGPYLFDHPIQDIQKFVQSDLMTTWKKDAQKSGLRVLAMNWYLGDRDIISDKAFSKPGDLSGVLIRVPDSPTFLNLFKTLGAKPVSLAWSEVYTSLSEGVVDAAEAPLSTIYDSKLYEVADTITLTEHLNAVVGWTMSEQVFDKLSPADQKVLLDEFAKAGQKSGDLYEQSEKDARKKLEAAGVHFVDADTNAYQQATLDFYTKFPSWPSDLRDKVRAAVGE